MIETVTEETYEAFKQAEKAILMVKLGTCSSCIMQGVVLEKLAERFAEENYGIPIGMIDAEQRSAGVKRDYMDFIKVGRGDGSVDNSHEGFRTFPTTLFYRSGTIVHSEQRVLGIDDVLELVKQYFPIQKTA